MRAKRLTSIILVLGVASLLMDGCAGQPSRPPTQAEQDQIRKDADVTFDKLKEEEQKAGKGPPQPY